MSWISTKESLPQDGERVLAFIPENYVPEPGNPTEAQLIPIKIVTFVKDFYGGHKARHKNSESDDFWSGEGLSNHFFQEVSHWMPLPENP